MGLKQVKVQLKLKHIKSGVPLNTDCCAVALALKEHFGLPVSVLGPDFAFHERINNGKTLHKNYCHSLTSQGRSIIRRFDEGIKVQPTQFYVYIKEDWKHGN